LSQNADPISTMYSQVTTDKLRCPADREIEEVSEDDLDDERDEHQAEQAGDDVFRASPHPGDRRGNRHGMAFSGFRRTCWLPASRAAAVMQGGRAGQVTARTVAAARASRSRLKRVDLVEHPGGHALASSEAR
jgi:hypothetical protein